MSLQALLNPRDDCQKVIGVVIQTMIESGFVPCDFETGLPTYTQSNSGSVSLQIVPEGFFANTSDVYQLKFLPGPTTLKLLIVGNKLALHAVCQDEVTSLNIDLNTPVTGVTERVRSGLIPYLKGSTSNLNTRDDYDRQQRPRAGRLPPDDPLRILPGHTPDGGDLVGPHNPIFGDPRFDPIGPGNIGEPDYDHQLPGPFGAPRQPRRPNFPFR